VGVTNRSHWNRSLMPNIAASPVGKRRRDHVAGIHAN
jgi:hypothetical protein